MTRRRKISWFLVLGAVIALTAIVLHDRFMAGPVYGGAPLSLWLRMLDYRFSPSPDKARVAIRRLGPAATPLVVEWLDWQDSLFRRSLNDWITGDPKHLDFQPLDAKDRRRLALDACDALGPAAQPAIPRLVAIATGRNPELDAPYLIARLGGPDAAPALARLATSTNKFISAAANVSAELLRTQSPMLKPDTTELSEQDDYDGRLKDFHALVLQAVTADKRSASPR